MQTIGAISIFLGVIFVWRIIYVKRGNIRFWQLATNQPDAAYEWMENRPDWTILHPDDPRIEQLKNNSEFVGPFKLVIPRLDNLVIIFVGKNSINESQDDFIKLYGGEKEDTRFPWFSSIAMLYPIIAMVAIAKESPILPTLGYGFTNLGYLLLVSGLLAGGFRALGFSYRIPTLIASISIWIVGTVLSNI
jgi:hypothetical protein